MRAGSLRRRIQIQKPVTTTDGEGTESVVWSPLVSTWAEIDWLQGRQVLEAEQVEHPRTVTVTVRNQPSIPITAAMRVVYGVRVFEIQAIVPDQEPPRSLALTCTERHP